ncbi:MAG: NAD(P)/FAD-dependent oxidoreductase [Ignavibacteria bacterium]|nr:NAD(P)/FAD-dependent oxidoreductase [Ignavibacteria bacterium]
MLTSLVAVVGAGPAGISASLQLNKFGIHPLIFEKNKVGGLILNAYRIDNFPGYPNGIEGKKLAHRFKKHLLKENKVVFEEIVRIEFVDDTFILGSNSNTYKCKYLVLATGTKPKLFEPFHILSQIADKVFYDLAQILPFKRKKIIIIGGGDLAFDYALSLAKNNEVIICNRAIEPKCNISLFREVASNKKITYHENLVLKFTHLSKTEGVVCVFQKGNNSISIQCDFVLIAIGRVPNIGLLTQLNQDLVADLIANKRIFLIGDVANGKFRQTAISVGDGSKSAMEIYFQINKIEKAI